MDYIKTLKNISINCMIDVKTLRIVLKYSRNQKYHALVGQKSGGRKVQKRNSHYFWNRPSYSASDPEGTLKHQIKIAHTRWDPL